MGYNGTDFGLIHQYGGAAEIRTLTITAAASGAETVNVTVNGVTSGNINVTAGTEAQNAHEIAVGLNADSTMSAFYYAQNGDTVVAVAASDGAKSLTYSISSSGTCDGTWAQDSAGASKTTVMPKGS